MFRCVMLIPRMMWSPGLHPRRASLPASVESATVCRQLDHGAQCPDSTATSDGLMASASRDGEVTSFPWTARPPFKANLDFLSFL